MISALAAATIIWGWSGAGETDSGLEYMQRVLAHNEVLTVESLVQLYCLFRRSRSSWPGL